MNEQTMDTTTARALEIFPWNDNFATGIVEVDAQHMRLIKLLNVLVGHLAFNADAPTLNKIFDELKDYTVVHFSTEERLWHEFFKDDPWEAWHRDAHSDFVAKVLEIKQQDTKLPTDIVIASIVSFLTRWLALHIIESDKRMAKVVLALPSGISLEHAKEQANKEMEGATRVLINTVIGMYDKLANRTVELTREIGRRMKAEAELRTTQEELLRVKNAAVMSNDAKSQFLATMSHEIRTPMNGVIGMAEVLLSTHLTEEQREMANVIRDSGEVQLAILNDILDFSKIEAGKLDLSPQPLTLSDVVEKACAIFVRQAQQKGGSLQCHVDPTIPSAVEGDALRVRQILTNLISNAIKFSCGSGRSGKVEVSAQLLESAASQVWVELSVRDNGIGMDAAALERVFHPFTQADASTTRSFGGTGLGLVISTRLAEAMGGEIQAKSMPDEGSTFTVRLPFLRSKGMPLSNVADADSPALAQVTLPRHEDAIRLGQLVLVAEDNETNQMVIRHQLSKLGYQCDIARDGQEALKKWMTGGYSLVLPDIHMPNMDGYQLAAAIRSEEARRGTGRTPILALSANVLDGEAEQCRRSGMDGYMVKPVQLTNLKLVLERWLRAAAPRAPFDFTIMLLDDDAFMHDLISSMLQKLGCSDISCYVTGDSALIAYDKANTKPDVILLDINMPGMDGIQFVEHLKQRNFSGSLILVSGEDEMTLRTTEKLAQEVDLCVVGSIQKPPLLQRLEDLLRQCVGKTVSKKPKEARTIYDADALRTAISNGELVNYYQPKVKVPSGEWIGVETLVRWNHPTAGLVSPDQFLPAAETNGMIRELTRAVLKQAIRQARQWREAGLDLRLAINVSMDDLSDMKFAEFAIEQVTLNKIPPQSIILEITEGQLMQDFATALQVLARLRLKRFRLSIDDFGTGNSSLAQLRDLPFDELKIDQSFTHNACADERLKAIFVASLEMAKRLNMESVAEGVEDHKDWTFLITTDVDVAQGYYISRPLPAEDISDWHSQWRIRCQDSL